MASSSLRVKASQMDNVDGFYGPPFQLPKQFQIVINTCGIQFERVVFATDERFTEANEYSAAVSGHGAWI